MTAQPSHSPAARALAVSISLSLAALAGCEVVSKDATKKQDTTVIVPSTGAARAAAPAPATPRDSTRPAGVPAVPTDSAAAAVGTAGAAGAAGTPGATGTPGAAGAVGATPAAQDTGVVRLYPSQPRRGGVLFAFAEGVATTIPRCTWKGAPLPCYTSGGGVLATVPLPADEPAGAFTLTIDRPNGRITRQITVADRDLGRELIFLDRQHYALVTRGRDISRDARALRGVLSTESPERQWAGRWREPLPGGRSTVYGVERFYYPASDSSRAIALNAQARTRGAFGTDTSETPEGGAPSWRHAGIDIPGPMRAAVSAPAAGTVIDVGEYVLSGRTLAIDHGQGVVTAYFHLDTALVRKGDLVRAGRVVGRVGVTGLTTGPHLHYGVYLHGKDVDPAAWRDMPDFARGDTTRASASVERR